MINAVFEKTMENVRKGRDINLVITERRKNDLVPEPNSHTTKFFTDHLLAKEMKKTEILMSKPVHVGLSILTLNKILIFEFWYYYLKPKFGEKVKLCYMDYRQFHSIHKNG